MHADNKRGGNTLKAAAVLLCFTVILIAFCAEALVLADTSYAKYKCDVPIPAFHAGSVLIAVPLILFCFYYMAKGGPYKGQNSAQTYRKWWITTAYVVVTS